MSFEDGLSHSQKCVSSTGSCYSGWNIVEYVFLCYVVWWISYFFLTLATKQSEEWCCRALTFLHGCVISYLAVKDIVLNGSDYGFQCMPLTENQKEFLCFMLSYFLFDFCWIHFIGNEEWIIYVHHFASILIIIKVLVSDCGGSAISYGVAGLEFTNPYLQLRWFLRTYGYLNKPIHTAVELWFFFTFFISRMIGGTLLVYYTETQTADFGLKLSMAAIYLISLILQWQICLYFKRKYWKPPLFHSRIRLHDTRISISAYFQRRTLDTLDNDRQNEDS